MAVDSLRAILVNRDADIHGGEPVFAGTRVPVETLVDWLLGGDSIDDFLENYPAVSREQVIAALEVLRETLLKT